MAASCAQLSRQICKTSRLFNKTLKEPWHRRSFGLSPAVCQEPAAAVSGSEAEIVIPRKKTWSKEAVLQALASTVNRDPTASHYMFQDDSYLTPRTSGEFKLYSLSQESGRNAAKYFINTYPKYFQKDFAEPHIPCLMPETVELQIEEVSQAALVERIRLRKVKAAVDMYDQLVQAATPPSLDLTNDLLDLICLYGDRDPPREDSPEQRTDDVGEEQDDSKRRKGRPRRASELLTIVWRENNNAQRIFNTMPERNSRSYGALIRGMVKYGAYSKALDMYTDLLNNRLMADVHTFSALIIAAAEVKDKYSDRWELIIDLLKQMAQQKVKPNLLTFNTVLKVLRRCGSLARVQAFPILNEMKALGIEPSLATYDHILGIFYKAASSAQGHTEILQEVLNEISGKSFTAQDPDDVQFFPNAMRVCLDNKDIEQAYRVHGLLEVGDNWQLLGDSYHQSIYYGRFFNLLCMMEHIDVVLKWYRELIPSLYFPNSQGIKDLLQALDMDNRLDLIPQIWKDIKQMGHDNKTDLLEQILSLMAREKQGAEVQQSFAECALDVKKLYTQTDRGRAPLNWSTNSLSSITSILLAAEKTQEAGEMLNIFKATNRIPSDDLVNEFFACIKAHNDAQQAVELVRLSASFCLPVTPNLIERVQEEFELTDEQKMTLSDLESSTHEGFD
ncbi:small ribosomal subunit protein mS39 isoform X1 [Neoarius graeffei]|uniref:small ribosomal subunit protein mS39 isoform X1 n=1 Tax=Neoarius graeffei TaxID=443677 RepID=UPI00298D561B|nr:small ribosomal subunit protein mS39 isoform X1 [Neoarius graeffei]XP_060783416.1 small ribosomal subunit protein mS39 isoform X1 [Neoarius graeffei]